MKNLSRSRNLKRRGMTRSFSKMKNHEPYFLALDLYKLPLRRRIYIAFFILIGRHQGYGMTSGVTHANKTVTGVRI